MRILYVIGMGIQSNILYNCYKMSSEEEAELLNNLKLKDARINSANCRTDVFG